MIAVVVGAVIFPGVLSEVDPPPLFGFLLGIVVNFGVLGFAVGLASLLSKFGQKFLSIGGIVLSALVLIIELGLALLD